jgi:hypothetical protein
MTILTLKIKQNVSFCFDYYCYNCIGVDQYNINRQLNDSRLINISESRMLNFKKTGEKFWY